MKPLCCLYTPLHTKITFHRLPNLIFHNFLLKYVNKKRGFPFIYKYINNFFVKQVFSMNKRKRYMVTADASEAFACSLVTDPAVEELFVAFNEHKEIVEKLSDDKKHMITGVVAIPNKPIYRRDPDGEEYDLVFSAEAIESMAKKFMKDFRQKNVTLQHQEEADGIYMVEQWIKTDSVYDKSISLGFSRDIPNGAWFQTYYVDSNEVWERIMSNELRGFSLECALSVDEIDFNKQVKEESMEVNENFWDKLRNVLSEAFAKFSMQKKDEEPAMVEEMMEAEAETPVNETIEPVETPVEPVSEPEVDNTPVEEEKPVTEPENEPEAKPAEQEPNPLEELVKNLMEEVKTLKEMNNGLNEKIKDMEKQPSAQPTNTNAKAGNANSYSAWREKMRSMIG